MYDWQVDASQLPPAAEPLESYVMVEREDVVEAIGAFVAAYLVQLPEADKLKPEELQVAVKHAFLVTAYRFSKKYKSSFAHKPSKSRPFLAPDRYLAGHRTGHDEQTSMQLSSSGFSHTSHSHHVITAARRAALSLPVVTGSELCA